MGHSEGEITLLNVVVRVSLNFTEVVCKPRPGKSERTSHVNVTIRGRSSQAAGAASTKS